MSHLDGIYAATLTPFNNDESVDFDGVKALIKNAQKQKLDGVYVGGSTAEAFMMNVSERKAVLEATADAGVEGMKMIAHVGSIRTMDCCSLASSAKANGYDAVSAVTPFYYPFGFDALVEHYQRIIEAADGLPMVIYNFPAMSGVKLSAEQIAKLMNLENVAALKQTSGDMYQMEQLAAAYQEKTIFNGFDEVFLAGQMAGAKGGIGSTYNVMGYRYANIIQALKQNDIETARAEQFKANRVIDVLCDVGVLPGLKYILKKQEVIANDRVRRPLQQLTREQESKLDQLFELDLLQK
ncbi:N-acetylneuraminate lyase [Vibrio sp. JC009]|uniref:N-acetylneuraminate lyase n=1 Tax=Vibrio sp. JC009 TaxID=2912314 RepID=UPI0023B10B4E|nr:N-acetylneuraminate lyase [Vibrio sp. JC009]WED24932.1 N-acetylneuraminate lyase [Vibrio sp. JC009]